VTRSIVRGLPSPATARLEQVIDLGCGTGSAGAAWALEAQGARLRGFDRSPWAVAEANWTYRQFGIDARAAHMDIGRATFRAGPRAGILLAYAVNELPDEARVALLSRLLAARRSGARILVIEPIARRMAGWWPSWEAAVIAGGGVAAEWRFGMDLPSRQRALARAAGLDPRELTARSLFLH
jgi:trans-aconitate methyltransferase